MNTKQVLFIDDGNVTEIIEKLRNLLKKQGITLVDFFLNLKDSKYRKPNPEDEDETVLDFELIKTELEDKFMNTRFDYVLCDFNFNDKSLNGFKLIKWLKNVSKNERKFKIRHARYSLYSSEKDKSIKDAFSEDEMGYLVKLKLEDFYDRTKISEELGSAIINNEREVSLKRKFISELDRYKEMKFQSVYPKFKGLTLNEIANEIEDDTYHGRAFQEVLVELTISHMINLNEE